MTQSTRREMLKTTASATAGIATGLTILQNPKSVTAAPAANRVILAGVGVRGRGHSLMQGFLERDDCRYAYLCDVDQSVLPSRSANAEQLQGSAPKCVSDFRTALDDPAVDAIVVATPDHWHALATIWACQAGKDVYVEKPASQNCWEGQKMVDAARKYQCMVQVGMQNRSAPYNIEAKRLIDAGVLGDIHLCRVFNMKHQGNFTLAKGQTVPSGLNWDMWQGPASPTDYSSTIQFAGWHHLWNYSGGDLGNDGIHQVDLARWLCGVELPNSVFCHGGRFDTEGDAETPDTQITSLDYDDMIMTFDLTLYTPYMLKTDMELRQSDMIPYWLQNATRIEIFGSKAMMVVGRHGGGWEIYARPQSRKPVVKSKMYGRFPDPEHKANFVESVKTRKLPSADIAHGHCSASLVHYANISHRVDSQKLDIDRKTGQIVDNAGASKLYKRTGRGQWTIPDEV